MRRKYLKDSVTGKPYDPATGQYILDELADSVLGDIQDTVAPAPTPMLRRKQAEQPTFTYTPPAGFAADPHEWLQQLRAGEFTQEQVVYLRSNARVQYADALASAHSNVDLAAVVALGDEILTAWDAALRRLDDTEPPLFHDPFNSAP